MKNQALFSSKNNSKKLKCRLLQFLFGVLRVNIGTELPQQSIQILVSLCYYTGAIFAYSLPCWKSAFLLCTII